MDQNLWELLEQTLWPDSQLGFALVLYCSLLIDVYDDVGEDADDDEAKALDTGLILGKHVESLNPYALA